LEEGCWSVGEEVEEGIFVVVPSGGVVVKRKSKRKAFVWFTYRERGSCGPTLGMNGKASFDCRAVCSLVIVM
jgi:hypothetical protein